MLRGILLSVAVVFFAASASADPTWREIIHNGEQPVWHHPAGYFSVPLPRGWSLAHYDGDSAEFRKAPKNYAYVGQVSVYMRGVPPGAELVHVSRDAQKRLQKGLAVFKVDNRRQVKIGGIPAVTTHFQFRERGNIEYPVFGIQTVFVDADRSWTIQLISRNRSFFEEDFGKMVEGFVQRGTDTKFTPDANRRQRPKVGDMVNPDALGY